MDEQTNKIHCNTTHSPHRNIKIILRSTLPNRCTRRIINRTIIGWLISKYEPILTNASFHISKLREDSILVIFFTIIIIIDLIIPEEYYGAYVILGYFIGYLAFKTNHSKQKPRPQTTKTNSNKLHWWNNNFGNTRNKRILPHNRTNKPNTILHIRNIHHTNLANHNFINF